MNEKGKRGEMSTEAIVATAIGLAVLVFVFTGLYQLGLFRIFKGLSGYTYNETDREIDISTLPPEQVAQGCLTNRVGWIDGLLHADKKGDNLLKKLWSWGYRTIWETRAFVIFSKDAQGKEIMYQSKLFVAVHKSNKMDLRIIDGSDIIVGTIEEGKVTIEPSSFTNLFVLLYVPYKDLVRLNGAQVAGTFLCKTGELAERDVMLLDNYYQSGNLMSSYSYTFLFKTPLSDSKEGRIDDEAIVYWSATRNQVEMLLSPNGKFIDKIFARPQELFKSNDARLLPFRTTALGYLQELLVNVQDEPTLERFNNEVWKLREKENVEVVSEGSIPPKYMFRFYFKSDESDLVYTCWNPNFNRPEFYFMVDGNLEKKYFTSYTEFRDYLPFKPTGSEKGTSSRTGLSDEEFNDILTLFGATSPQELALRISNMKSNVGIEVPGISAGQKQNLSPSHILELMLSSCQRGY